ncbi:MAG: N-acetylmuramoyl-L-alanine amidase, partial [Alphaproteobacteria bacterium]
MRRFVGAVSFVLAILSSYLLLAGPPPGAAGTARAQDASTAMIPNWMPANAPDSPAAARPSVVTIRMGDHPDKTRLVLEMTAAPNYRVFTLDNPHRMVIDFPAMDWRADGDPDAAVGLIARLRHGIQDGGSTRVVLELKGPARVVDTFFLPAVGSMPYRFVLDLAPVEPARTVVGDNAPAGGERAMPVAGLHAAALQVPLPPRRPSRRLDRRIVAIDAGHGGIDPGAIGATGLREKDLTLGLARDIGERLEATGRYRVFLTRDSDVYLRLSERVRRAREAGADLFISLHADTIENSAVRGMSVYTLSSVASDREAALLAARENRADALAGVALDPTDDITASILIDLAQRQTQNESNSMAEIIVATARGEMRLLNTPHRQAGFAVLKAPDVPSVLVELGYLSNRQEERNLRSPDHLRRVADGLAEAIDGYFAWLDA